MQVGFEDEIVGWCVALSLELYICGTAQLKFDTLCMSPASTRDLRKTICKLSASTQMWIEELMAHDACESLHCMQ